MFGIDDTIAGLSDGSRVLLVLAVAVVLGLRHASDPDHLAAVATLVASTKEHSRRAAARLGLAWGLGHATTLFAFGLPIVLFKSYLPEGVQRGAETAVGVVIVALAVWMLVRWRRGAFRHVHPHTHPHPHPHGATTLRVPRRTAGRRTVAVDVPRGGESHRRAHGTMRARTPLQAYAIGLVHGAGGSAGVGVLLLASIHDHLVAVGALVLFAGFTAISMSLLTTGLVVGLSTARVRRSFEVIAPVLGVASLAFGVWYGLGALGMAPYAF